MKNILSIVLVLGVFYFSYSQTRLLGSKSTESGKEVSFNWSNEVKLKKDIEDIGLTVANKIMHCCSSWGGTNVGADIDFENVKQNEVTGAFTIPLTVKWQGSLSGNQYWVQGKLLVYSDGSKSWLKIKDSGGFYPGCSKNCIN
ncbi:MAG: hypothetical protein ACK5LJ_17930 [Paracoccus sp. (in: a-proteobacteria)]